MIVDQAQAQWHRERALAFDRAMLRKWPDAAILEGLSAVLAGDHDGTRFRLARLPLPVMIEPLVEEATRRALAAKPEAGAE